MNLRKLTVLLGAATLVALTANATPALASLGAIGSFGTSGPGALKTPRGIAVSPSTGDVYVSDSEDNRVVEYDPSGNFILTFGEDVNQTKVGEGASQAEENVCTAASGNTCTVGTEGTAPGAFHYPAGLAVDPSTGDVYVADYNNDRIEKFSEDGEYVSQVAGNVAGVKLTLPVSNNLAVDLEGNLYVVARRGKFGAGSEEGAFEFDAAGDYTGQTFPSGFSPSDVAVDPFGTVYISANGALERFSQSGAALGDLVAGGGGQNQEALAVSLWDGELFVGGTNGAGEDIVRAYDASGAEIASFPTAQQSRLQALAYSVVTGRLYELYSPSLSEVAIYGTFPVPAEAAPSVSGESWANAGLSSVTLKAQVDPELLDTSYSFQYATDPQFEGATEAPSPAEDIGAGYLKRSVSVQLSGLRQSTEYYYRVVAHNSFGGGAGTTTYGSTQTFATLAPPPAVQTGSASEVSFDAATLNGIVTPGSSGVASSAMWCFEYGGAGGSGYDLGYLPGAPPGDAGQGTAAVPVSVRVTGLAPGASYRYRLIAVNSLGLGLSSTACGTEGGHETDGAEGMFTTSPVGPAPLVESGPAAAVSQGSAMLTGTVDPQGQRTVYSFQIGTDTDYGVELFGEAGASSQPQPVRVLAGYLQPGTTYHYRIVASNANGTVYGADESFTTPAYPTATLTAPVAPPLLAIPSNAKGLGGNAANGKKPRRRPPAVRHKRARSGHARRRRSSARHRSREGRRGAGKALAQRGRNRGRIGGNDR